MPAAHRRDTIAAAFRHLLHKVRLAITGRDRTAPFFEVLDLHVVFGEHHIPVAETIAGRGVLRHEHPMGLFAFSADGSRILTNGAGRSRQPAW